MVLFNFHTSSRVSERSSKYTNYNGTWGWSMYDHVMWNRIVTDFLRQISQCIARYAPRFELYGFRIYMCVIVYTELNPVNVRRKHAYQCDNLRQRDKHVKWNVIPNFIIFDESLRNCISEESCLKMKWKFQKKWPWIKSISISFSFSLLHQIFEFMDFYCAEYFLRIRDSKRIQNSEIRFIWEMA